MYTVLRRGGNERGQPGDYPVFTVADGTTVVVSGHPAERGTFDRFVSAMQRPDLAQDPRFADVPVTTGEPRCPHGGDRDVGGDGARRRDV